MPITTIISNPQVAVSQINQTFGQGIARKQQSSVTLDGDNLTSLEQVGFDITINNTATLGSFDQLLFNESGSKFVQVFGPHGRSDYFDKNGDAIAGTFTPTPGNPVYRPGNWVGVAAPTTGTDEEKNASIAEDLASILPVYWSSFVPAQNFAVSSASNVVTVRRSGFPLIDIANITLEVEGGNWAVASGTRTIVFRASLILTGGGITGSIAINSQDTYTKAELITLITNALNADTNISTYTGGGSDINFVSATNNTFTPVNASLVNVDSTGIIPVVGTVLLGYS